MSNSSTPSANACYAAIPDLNSQIFETSRCQFARYAGHRESRLRVRMQPLAARGAPALRSGRRGPVGASYFTSGQLPSAKGRVATLAGISATSFAMSHSLVDSLGFL